MHLEIARSFSRLGKAGEAVPFIRSLQISSAHAPGEDRMSYNSSSTFLFFVVTIQVVIAMQADQIREYKDPDGSMLFEHCNTIVVSEILSSGKAI